MYEQVYIFLCDTNIIQIKDKHINNFLEKKQWKLLQYASIKSSAQHRKKIAKALAVFQEKEAIKILERLLTDNIQEVAKEAICSLQQMEVSAMTTQRITKCIHYWIKHEERLQNSPRKSYDNWMDRDNMVRLNEIKERLKRPIR